MHHIIYRRNTYARSLSASYDEDWTLNVFVGWLASALAIVMIVSDRVAGVFVLTCQCVPAFAGL